MVSFSHWGNCMTGLGVSADDADPSDVVAAPTTLPPVTAITSTRIAAPHLCVWYIMVERPNRCGIILTHPGDFPRFWFRRVRSTLGPFPYRCYFRLYLRNPPRIYHVHFCVVTERFPYRFGVIPINQSITLRKHVLFVRPHDRQHCSSA